jgi:YVTN family beta-propeller protein
VLRGAGRVHHWRAVRQRNVRVAQSSLSRFAGLALKVGGAPEGVAITPDGKTAYVANEGSETVTSIEVATNKPGTEIKVGLGPAERASEQRPRRRSDRTISERADQGSADDRFRRGEAAVSPRSAEGARRSSKARVSWAAAKTPARRAMRE